MALEQNKPPLDLEVLEETPPSKIVLFLQLFLIPLGLVTLIVVTFLIFSLFFSSSQDVHQLIQELRSASPNRRGQAALELRSLIRNSAVSRDPSLSQELLAVFQEATDPTVKGCTAQMLGTLKERKAVLALQQAFQDKRNSSETKNFCLFALFDISPHDAFPEALKALNDEDATVRSSAIVVLANNNAPEVINSLKSKLVDNDESVQMNAALVLAKFGDVSGKATLLKLLDRDYLVQWDARMARKTNSPQMGGEQVAERIENILLHAITAVSRFHDKDLVEKLVFLSNNDPSLKVRDGARRALEEQNKVERK